MKVDRPYVECLGWWHQTTFHRMTYLWFGLWQTYHILTESKVWPLLLTLALTWWSSIPQTVTCQFHENSYIMLLGWGLNISSNKKLKFQTSCYHFNHKLRPHWWQHKHPIPALSSMPSNLVTVVHYSQGHNCPQLKQLGEWVWYVPLKFQALVSPPGKITFWTQKWRWTVPMMFLFQQGEIFQVPF